MSGLSPPTFATLFRQLLQQDTTLGATRGGRGLGEGCHSHDCHAVPSGLNDNGCPEAYGLPIVIFEHFSRVLLDFQLISVQSLSSCPGLHFTMPFRLLQMMLCKDASHCIIQST